MIVTVQRGLIHLNQSKYFLELLAVFKDQRPLSYEGHQPNEGDMSYCNK